REYRLALDAGEDRRLALQSMAEVHLLRRDLGAALELYDDLVRRHGDSPKLWNERGVCLHQAGRPHDAHSSYLRAVELDPRYRLARDSVGVARAAAGAEGAAAEAFMQALGGADPLPHARLNLALYRLQ